MLIAIAAISFIGCSTIDVVLSKKVDVSKKMKKIAVFPFEITGASWGNEFSDSITHHFFKTGDIEIVEREAIDKVIREQDMSMTGLIDDSKAVEIGKLLGADVIIIGRGTALRMDDDGKEMPNLIDTFTIKAISVEIGGLLFTVRKEPGAAWNGCYRAKYCMSFTLIWNKKDIIIESSQYDDISKQVVKNVMAALAEIEKKKNVK